MNAKARIVVELDLDQIKREIAERQYGCHWQVLQALEGRLPLNFAIEGLIHDALSPWRLRSNSLIHGVKIEEGGR